MDQDKSDLRIGELLIEAQIIRSRELSDAIKVTKLTGLPVGRVLVMSSYLHEREFQAAVKAQSLVRDGLVPLRTAIQALSLMSRSEISLEAALDDLGWAAASSDARTNKLGELLLECQVITPEQFEHAMRTSEATSLPLGRVLVSLGFLSDETLATALNAQVMIRDKKLTREQGINGLKAAHQRRMPLELTLAERGFYRGPAKPSIRLGELLVLAGLVSPTDVTTAIEVGLTSERLIGEVLVQQGLLTEAIVEAALTLQEMVSNRTLEAPQAAQCLLKIFAGETLDETLANLEVPQAEFKLTVRYHDVLRVAALLQHSDIELTNIETGCKPSSSDAIKTARELLKNGFLDQRTFYGSLRCYFLMATGWLTIQQGIIAMNYFHHKKHLAFDEVLLELNWVVRTRTRAVSEQQRAATGEKV